MSIQRMIFYMKLKKERYPQCKNKDQMRKFLLLRRFITIRIIANEIFGLEHRTL